MFNVTFNVNTHSNEIHSILLNGFIIQSVSVPSLLGPSAGISIVADVYTEWRVSDAAGVYSCKDAISMSGHFKRKLH